MADQPWVKSAALGMNVTVDDQLCTSCAHGSCVNPVSARRDQP